MPLLLDNGTDAARKDPLLLVAAIEVYEHWHHQDPQFQRNGSNLLDCASRLSDHSERIIVRGKLTMSSEKLIMHIGEGTMYATKNIRSSLSKKLNANLWLFAVFRSEL